MLEARSIVKSFDKIKGILESENALYKGEYIIHDIIYSSKDRTKTLIDEFLRLRFVQKNIWNEKEVVVAIKKTEVKTVGKNSIVPLKKQFDSVEEAQKYINENLLNRFEPSFEFSRTGWQYDIRGDQVDLENIEGIYSIEVKSESEEGLKKLANTFEMEDVLKGPSVLKVKELLKR